MEIEKFRFWIMMIEDFVQKECLVHFLPDNKAMKC